MSEEAEEVVQVGAKGDDDDYSGCWVPIGGIIVGWILIVFLVYTTIQNVWS